MAGEIETTQRSVSGTGDRLAVKVPALTLVCHSDMGRVGQRVRLVELAEGGAGEAAVSRLAPRFAEPGQLEQPGEPLGDPSVSRSPLRIRRRPDGDLELDSGGAEVRADGRALGDRVVVPAARLGDGVVIELGNRVVVLLHEIGPPVASPAPLGLVGASEAVDDLRRAILRAADLDIPVLLRGETGTGKERVAQALHEASPRREGPMVAVNTAALPQQTAAAALFGHVRGAFTGAVGERKGHFQEAAGGTLFLDEIGEVSMDVQAMLLRAIEQKEVQPVGAARAFTVDVRLVAATDSDLEKAIGQGRFREALLHRLSGYQIPVPALRARRDDIARLLLHFLREELAAFGEVDRVTRPRERPWLRGPVVAALVRNPWPGNVRQLRNVARQIAVSSRGQDEARIDPVVEELLAEAHGAAGGDHSDPVARAAPARRAEPSEQEVAEALERHHWRLAAAAAELGLSKTRMYAMAKRLGGVRTGRQVDGDEIRARLADAGGDLDAAAASLKLSRRALLLRMRELDIEPP